MKQFCNPEALTTVGAFYLSPSNTLTTSATSVNTRQNSQRATITSAPTPMVRHNSNTAFRALGGEVGAARQVEELQPRDKGERSNDQYFHNKIEREAAPAACYRGRWRALMNG